MDSEIITITVASQPYRVAGWGRRIVARGLDLVLILFACALPDGIFGALVVPVGIAYLFMGNGLMKGASLGKRALGMKIIDARHGGPCSVIQDLVRHRYLLYANPVFSLLMAYDSTKGCFDKPEIYIVHAGPLTDTEREVEQVVVREKPAKLDLAGMRETLEKMREVRKDEAAPRDE